MLSLLILDLKPVLESGETPQLLININIDNAIDPIFLLCSSISVKKHIYNAE